LEGGIGRIINALVASLGLPVEVETVIGEDVNINALVGLSYFN